MKKTLTALAVTGAGILGAVGPAGAAPVQAVTSATWDGSCSSITIESTKDLSNIVYRVDGVDTKIEFKGSITTFVLSGDITDVWVKSGNNKSGDGPGYGEHHKVAWTCGTSST